eukprot:2831484-Pleurochrysis_carterae.AAC.2
MPHQCHVSAPRAYRWGEAGVRRIAYSSGALRPSDGRPDALTPSTPLHGFFIQQAHYPSLWRVSLDHSPPQDTSR